MKFEQKIPSQAKVMPIFRKLGETAKKCVVAVANWHVNLQYLKAYSSKTTTKNLMKFGSIFSDILYNRKIIFFFKNCNYF